MRSDFRLIIATNRNLAEEVIKNRFRQDLFYRINVFPIEVPPLRSRKENIPLLAYHFPKMHSERLKKPVDKIAKSTMEQLISYSWPGNIRKLENLIERGVILSNDSFFRMSELHPNKSIFNDPEKALPSHEECERSLILQTLELTRGKINGKGGAADLLQINRTTFYYRMKKLGIKKTASNVRLFSD